MSDTPETDEELAYRAFGFYTMGGLPTDAVKVEFARKLERERDAFEKRLFDVRDVLLDAMPNANAPTKILAEMIVAERDAARENTIRHKEEAAGLFDKANIALRVKWVNALRTIVGSTMPKNKSGVSLVSDIDLILASDEQRLMALEKIK